MKPSIGDDLATLERNTHILIDEYELVVRANKSVYRRNVTLRKIINIFLSKKEINKLIDLYERDTDNDTNTRR